MPRLELETRIAAPPEVCFDLSLDVDAHMASTFPSRERAVAGVTSGVMRLGDEVTWEAGHFGILWHMTSRIVEHERPHRFVDQMQRGPFGRWRHVHLFEPVNGGTSMRDEIDFASPLGLLGRLVDAVVLRTYMTRLIERRNAHLKHAAEATPALTSQSPSKL
jgi:ligand-binding SRPBCC domain-containing protein